MENIKKMGKKYKYEALSFSLAFMAITIAYALIGIFPFGDKSVLIIDMYGQYIDYHTALYDIIKSGDFSQLLYSWNVGMGCSFIGLIAYYLASPLLFIMLLFPRTHILEAIFLINLIKISICSLTFFIMLKYLFNKKNLYMVIFSLLYALMSFNIVYSQNIMWLDAIYLLPLCILGVEKIIREDKIKILTISLIILFVTNFYMAYMVGIFIFLYFIVIINSSPKYIETKSKLNKFYRFCISTAIAVCCSMFIILPTFLALRSTGNMEPVNILLDINFSLFDLLGKLIIGASDNIMNGLPNIFSGTICIILIPLYFFNTKFRYKERILNLALLLFLIISLNISWLNLFWHAFDIPTGFVYRFSFLVSFLIILLSFKIMNSIKDINAKYIITSTLIYVGILILVQKIGLENINDRYVLLTIIFVILYGFIIHYINKVSDKKLISIVLLITVFAEIILNSFLLFKGLDKQYSYTNRQDFLYNIQARNNYIKEILDNDSEFYRVETFDIRSRNDSMNLGYSGITHFSSFTNHKLKSLLDNLGITGSEYPLVLWYQNSMEITDSLLGVKYLVASSVDDRAYEKKYINDNETTFINDNALSIAYMVDEDITSFKSNNNNNIFDNQNRLMNSLMGKSPEEIDYVNYYYNINDIDIEMYNLTMEIVDGKSIFRKIDNNDSAYIKLLILKEQNEIDLDEVSKDRYYVSLPVNNNVKVYIDNLEGIEFNPESIQPSNFITNRKDINSIKVELLENELTINSDKISDSIKMFDYDSFKRDIDILKSAQIKNLVIDNNRVSGKVFANENQVLLTTIPYNKGWRAYIDGEKVEVLDIDEGLLAIDVSKGEHEIELTYIPLGLIDGCTILLATSSLILIVYVINKRKRLKNNLGG